MFAKTRRRSSSVHNAWTYAKSLNRSYRVYLGWCATPVLFSLIKSWFSQDDFLVEVFRKRFRYFQLERIRAANTSSEWSILFSWRSRLSANNNTYSVLNWYHCRSLLVSRNAMSNQSSASVRSNSIRIAWTLPSQISYFVIPS